MWDGTNNSGNVVPEGIYSLELRVQDIAGNLTVRQTTVTVNYPPALSIAAVPFSAKVNETVNVTIYTNKALAENPTVSMIDSNSVAVPFTGPVVLGNSFSYSTVITPSIAEGSININVSGADAFGFTGTSTGTFAVNNLPDMRNLSSAPNPFSPNGDFANDLSSVTYELTTLH